MRFTCLVLSFIVSQSVFAVQDLDWFTIESKTIESKNRSPVIIMESPYSYKKTVSNLKKAIKGKNYVFIREQKVDHGFSDKNHESNDLIVYFCNFHILNKVLKKDTRIGQFLPCRITIIERDKKIYLMSVNPKSVGDLLNNAGLKKTCNQVTNMYRDIMDEVTI